MKELESNQLINQHYQQGWGWGTKEGRFGGGGVGAVPCLPKGKPFSLKKKKEQTRVVHGQIKRT